MTNTPALTSILDTPGRPMDSRVAFNQIGGARLYRLGAKDFLYGPHFIKFRVTCSPRRSVGVIVKLELNDIYSVEFGKLKQLDWVILDQQESVYSDCLGEVIERMYQEVYS